ncbi:hypothetical protein [Streptomyces sp. NPDC001816]
MPVTWARAFFGLKPHRAESFKPSTDPFFVDKVDAGRSRSAWMCT